MPVQDVIPQLPGRFPSSSSSSNDGSEALVAPAAQAFRRKRRQSASSSASSDPSFYSLGSSSPQRLLSISHQPTEPLSEYWIDVEDGLNYGNVLEVAIDCLERSADEHIPSNLSSYIFNTYAPHALSILIGMITQSGNTININDCSQTGLVGRASKEVNDAANRYIMKLPRRLTAADWITVYNDTIATPAFLESKKGIHKRLKTILGADIDSITWIT